MKEEKPEGGSGPSPVLINDDTCGNVAANRHNTGDDCVQTCLDNADALLMDALKVTGTTSRRDGQEAEATNSEDKKVMQHKNDGEPNECVALLSDVQRLKSDIE